MFVVRVRVGHACYDGFRGRIAGTVVVGAVIVVAVGTIVVITAGYGAAVATSNRLSIIATTTITVIGKILPF